MLALARLPAGVVAAATARRFALVPGSKHYVAAAAVLLRRAPQARAACSLCDRRALAGLLRRPSSRNPDSAPAHVRSSALQRAFHIRGPVFATAGIVDDVSARIKDAMKAKDTARLAALRNMRAALLVTMKDTGAETLDDAKAVETLRKLVKQRVDSITQYKAASRDDLVAAEEAELAIINSFLPQLADAATTEKWVREAIAALNASKPGDAGKVMGAVIKAHKAEVRPLRCSAHVGYASDECFATAG